MRGKEAQTPDMAGKMPQNSFRDGNAIRAARASAKFVKDDERLRTSFAENLLRLTQLTMNVLWLAKM
jgi:hypothetical protein